MEMCSKCVFQGACDYQGITIEDKRCIPIMKEVNMRQTRECQGQCSCCMSENVTYGTFELDGSAVYYEISCNDCGAIGKEWSNLEYTETTMETEDNEKTITYKDLAILMGGRGEFSMGGIESINVKAKVLKDLAKEYPEMFDLESNQNNSPTVGEFLEGSNDEDIFLTYVVGDSRDDKRISIEGIETKSRKVADLFLKSHPDEYDRIKGVVHLWWD